jgi:hypothetical protein
MRGVAQDGDPAARPAREFVFPAWSGGFCPAAGKIGTMRIGIGLPAAVPGAGTAGAGRTDVVLDPCSGDLDQIERLSQALRSAAADPGA